MDSSNTKSRVLFTGSLVTFVVFISVYVTQLAFPFTESMPSARNAVLDTIQDKHIRRSLISYHTEACELDEIKSHKTVCCSDMDYPAMGGIDLVELTKELFSAEEMNKAETEEDSEISQGETENTGTVDEGKEVTPDSDAEGPDAGEVETVGGKTELNEENIIPSIEGRTELPEEDIESRRRLDLDAAALEDLDIADFLDPKALEGPKEEVTEQKEEVILQVPDAEATESEASYESNYLSDEITSPDEEVTDAEDGNVDDSLDIAEQENEEEKIVSEEEDDILPENGNRTPVLGSEDFAGFLPTSVGLYKFLFVSEENRNLFLQDPWKYVPAYGGFDAEGIALEEKAHDKKYVAKLGPMADLSSWEIIDNRLFFFGSLKGKNLFKDSEKAISLGDATWMSYYDSPDVYDGYINTNCFIRTTFEQLESGEVFVERNAPTLQLSGKSGGGNGGSGGSGGGETKVETLYVTPPSVLEVAQAKWKAEEPQTIMDTSGGREFSLTFLSEDKINADQ